MRSESPGGQRGQRVLGEASRIRFEGSEGESRHNGWGIRGAKSRGWEFRVGFEAQRLGGGVRIWGLRLQAASYH